jgi:hypothetical protein
MKNKEISWDEAIKSGGFYFFRAKNLGLPKPKWNVVYDDEHEDTLHYQILFKEAEIVKSIEFGEKNGW